MGNTFKEREAARVAEDATRGRAVEFGPRVDPAAAALNQNQQAVAASRSVLEHSHRVGNELARLSRPESVPQERMEGELRRLSRAPASGNSEEAMRRTDAIRHEASDALRHLGAGRTDEAEAAFRRAASLEHLDRQIARVSGQPGCGEAVTIYRGAFEAVSHGDMARGSALAHGADLFLRATTAGERHRVFELSRRVYNAATLQDAPVAFMEIGLRLKMHGHAAGADMVARARDMITDRTLENPVTRRRVGALEAADRVSNLAANPGLMGLTMRAYLNASELYDRGQNAVADSFAMAAIGMERSFMLGIAEASILCNQLMQIGKDLLNEKSNEEVEKLKKKLLDAVKNISVKSIKKLAAYSKSKKAEDAKLSAGDKKLVEAAIAHSVKLAEAGMFEEAKKLLQAVKELRNAGAVRSGMAKMKPKSDFGASELRAAIGLYLKAKTKADFSKAEEALVKAAKSSQQAFLVHKAILKAAADYWKIHMQFGRAEAKEEGEKLKKSEVRKASKFFDPNRKIDRLLGKAKKALASGDIAGAMSIVRKAVSATAAEITETAKKAMARANKRMDEAERSAGGIAKGLSRLLSGLEKRIKEFESGSVLGAFMAKGLMGKWRKDKAMADYDSSPKNAAAIREYRDRLAKELGSLKAATERMKKARADMADPKKREDAKAEYGRAVEEIGVLQRRISVLQKVGDFIITQMQKTAKVYAMAHRAEKDPNYCRALLAADHHFREALLAATRGRLGTLKIEWKAGGEARCHTTDAFGAYTHVWAGLQKLNETVSDLFGHMKGLPPSGFFQRSAVMSMYELSGELNGAFSLNRSQKAGVAKGLALIEGQFYAAVEMALSGKGGLAQQLGVLNRNLDSLRYAVFAGTSGHVTDRKAQFLSKLFSLWNQGFEDYQEAYRRGNTEAMRLSYASMTSIFDPEAGASLQTLLATDDNSLRGAMRGHLESAFRNTWAALAAMSVKENANHSVFGTAANEQVRLFFADIYGDHRFSVRKMASVEGPTEASVHARKISESLDMLRAACLGLESRWFDAAFSFDPGARVEQRQLAIFESLNSSMALNRSLISNLRLRVDIASERAKGSKADQGKISSMEGRLMSDSDARKAWAKLAEYHLLIARYSLPKEKYLTLEKEYRRLGENPEIRSAYAMIAMMSSAEQQQLRALFIKQNADLVLGFIPGYNTLKEAVRPEETLHASTVVLDVLSAFAYAGKAVQLGRSAAGALSMRGAARAAQRAGTVATAEELAEAARATAMGRFGGALERALPRAEAISEAAGTAALVGGTAYGIYGIGEAYARGEGLYEATLMGLQGVAIAAMSHGAMAHARKAQGRAVKSRFEKLQEAYRSHAAGKLTDLQMAKLDIVPADMEVFRGLKGKGEENVKTALEQRAAEWVAQTGGGSRLLRDVGDMFKKDVAERAGGVPEAFVMPTEKAPPSAAEREALAKRYLDAKDRGIVPKDCSAERFAALMDQAESKISGMGSGERARETIRFFSERHEGRTNARDMAEFLTQEAANAPRKAGTGEKALGELEKRREAPRAAGAPKAEAPGLTRAETPRGLAGQEGTSAQTPRSKSREEAAPGGTRAETPRGKMAAEKTPAVAEEGGFRQPWSERINALEGDQLAYSRAYGTYLSRMKGLTVKETFGECAEAYIRLRSDPSVKIGRSFEKHIRGYAEELRKGSKVDFESYVRRAEGLPPRAEPIKAAMAPKPEAARPPPIPAAVMKGEGGTSAGTPKALKARPGTPKAEAPKAQAPKAARAPGAKLGKGFKERFTELNGHEAFAGAMIAWKETGGVGGKALFSECIGEHIALVESGKSPAPLADHIRGYKSYLDSGGKGSFREYLHAAEGILPGEAPQLIKPDTAARAAFRGMWKGFRKSVVSESGKLHAGPFGIIYEAIKGTVMGGMEGAATPKEGKAFRGNLADAFRKARWGIGEPRFLWEPTGPIPPHLASEPHIWVGQRRFFVLGEDAARTVPGAIRYVRRSAFTLELERPPAPAQAPAARAQPSEAAAARLAAYADRTRALPADPAEAAMARLVRGALEDSPGKQPEAAAKSVLRAVDEAAAKARAIDEGTMKPPPPALAGESELARARAAAVAKAEGRDAPLPQDYQRGAAEAMAMARELGRIGTGVERMQNGLVDVVRNARQVIAVGDIHGDAYAVVDHLLKAGVLRDREPGKPVRDTPAHLLSKRFELNPELPKGSQIVFTGDLIDRGPTSMEAVDLVRSIQRQAAARGDGTLVHTIRGNHEEIFRAFLNEFGKPGVTLDQVRSGAADGLVMRQYGRVGVKDTVESIIRTYKDDPRVRPGEDPWQASLRLMKEDGVLGFINGMKGAVIIDGNYFTHGGPVVSVKKPDGSVEAVKTPAQLDSHFARLFADPDNAWTMTTVVDSGGDFSNVYVGAQGWWKKPEVKKWMDELGVGHIVVGHDRGDGVRSLGGHVTNIDVSMSEAYGGGTGILVMDPLRPQRPVGVLEGRRDAPASFLPMPRLVAEAGGKAREATLGEVFGGSGVADAVRRFHESGELPKAAEAPQPSTRSPEAALLESRAEALRKAFGEFADAYARERPGVKASAEEMQKIADQAGAKPEASRTPAEKAALRIVEAQAGMAQANDALLLSQAVPKRAAENAAEAGRLDTLYGSYLKDKSKVAAEDRTAMEWIEKRTPPGSAPSQETLSLAAELSILSREAAYIHPDPSIGTEWASALGVFDARLKGLMWEFPEAFRVRETAVVDGNIVRIGSPMRLGNKMGGLPQDIAYPLYITAPDGKTTLTFVYQSESQGSWRRWVPGYMKGPVKFGGREWKAGEPYYGEHLQNADGRIQRMLDRAVTEGRAIDITRDGKARIELEEFGPSKNGKEELAFSLATAREILIQQAMDASSRAPDISKPDSPDRPTKVERFWWAQSQVYGKYLRVELTSETGYRYTVAVTEDGMFLQSVESTRGGGITERGAPSRGVAVKDQYMMPIIEYGEQAPWRAGGVRMIGTNIGVRGGRVRILSGLHESDAFSGLNFGMEPLYRALRSKDTAAVERTMDGYVKAGGLPSAAKAPEMNISQPAVDARTAVLMDAFKEYAAGKLDPSTDTGRARMAQLGITLRDVEVFSRYKDAAASGSISPQGLAGRLEFNARQWARDETMGRLETLIEAHRLHSEGRLDAGWMRDHGVAQDDVALFGRLGGKGADEVRLALAERASRWTEERLAPKPQAPAQPPAAAPSPQAAQQASPMPRQDPLAASAQGLIMNYTEAMAGPGKRTIWHPAFSRLSEILRESPMIPLERAARMAVEDLANADRLVGLYRAREPFKPNKRIMFAPEVMAMEKIAAAHPGWSDTQIAMECVRTARRQPPKPLISVGSASGYDLRSVAAKSAKINWTEKMDTALMTKASERGADEDILFEAFLAFSKKGQGGSLVKFLSALSEEKGTSAAGQKLAQALVNEARRSFILENADDVLSSIAKARGLDEIVVLDAYVRFREAADRKVNWSGVEEIEVLQAFGRLLDKKAKPSMAEAALKLPQMVGDALSESLAAATLTGKEPKGTTVPEKAAPEQAAAPEGISEELKGRFMADKVSDIVRRHSPAEARELLVLKYGELEVQKAMSLFKEESTAYFKEHVLDAGKDGELVAIINAGGYEAGQRYLQRRGYSDAAAVEILAIDKYQELSVAYNKRLVRQARNEQPTQRVIDPKTIAAVRSLLPPNVNRLEASLIVLNEASWNKLAELPKADSEFIIGKLLEISHRLIRLEEGESFATLVTGENAVANLKAKSGNQYSIEFDKGDRVIFYPEDGQLKVHFIETSARKAEYNQELTAIGNMSHVARTNHLEKKMAHSEELMPPPPP